jgi:hypothetical protein
MQHASINNPARHRFEKFVVRNTSEVVREVGVNDFRAVTKQLRLHLDHRLLGGSPGARRTALVEGRLWDLRSLESADLSRRTPKADNSRICLWRRRAFEVNL